MSRRDGEKTRLPAALLNSSAGACVTTGIMTPTVAVFFNFGNTAGNVPFRKLPVSGVGFAIAAVEWFALVGVPIILIIGAVIAERLHARWRDRLLEEKKKSAAGSSHGGRLRESGRQLPPQHRAADVRR
jgi:hypothetical protein